MPFHIAVGDDRHIEAWHAQTGVKRREGNVPSWHHPASDELKSRKDFELSLVRFSNPLLDVGWLLLISAKLHCNVENGGDALIRRTLVPSECRLINQPTPPKISPKI